MSKDRVDTTLKCANHGHTPYTRAVIAVLRGANIVRSTARAVEESKILGRNH